MILFILINSRGIKTTKYIVIVTPQCQYLHLFWSNDKYHSCSSLLWWWWREGVSWMLIYFLCIYMNLRPITLRQSSSLSSIFPVQSTFTIFKRTLQIHVRCAVTMYQYFKSIRQSKRKKKTPVAKALFHDILNTTLVRKKNFLNQINFNYYYFFLQQQVQSNKK